MPVLYLLKLLCDLLLGQLRLVFPCLEGCKVSGNPKCGHVGKCIAAVSCEGSAGKDHAVFKPVPEIDQPVVDRRLNQVAHGMQNGYSARLHEKVGAHECDARIAVLDPRIHRRLNLDF